jgi:chromosome segregation ATPase
MEESTQKRKKEEDRAGVQVSVMAEEVRRLTGRLESCQEELSQLRPDVHRLREREESHRHQLVRKQEEVHSLHRQLEATWTDHQTSLQQTEARWTARLRDARSDYQRLKAVSTRRCAELAQEAWQLKSTLESLNHL